MSGPISEPRQAKPSPSIRQIGSSTKRPHRKNISREHLRPKPCEQRTASIHHPFLVFSAPNSAPLYLPFRFSSLRCSANSASLYPEAREGCVRFSLLKRKRPARFRAGRSTTKQQFSLRSFDVLYYLWPQPPPAEPPRRQVRRKSCNNDHYSKYQAIHPQHGLAPAMQNSQAQHQQRKHSNQNRADHSTRHAELSFQLRLPNPQHHQRHKLQHQARPIQNNVQRNQPLKSQSQAKRPSRRQHHNRHPRRSRLRMRFAKYLRQHSVLSHRQRQPRIAHHQRIEHPKRAHHSAQHQQKSQPVCAVPGAAHQPGHLRPSSFTRERRCRHARQVYRGKWQHVRQRDQDHRCNHRFRIRSLRPLHFQRNRRRVIPTHVIPHRDQHPTKEPNCAHSGCSRRNRRATCSRQLEWRKQNDQRKRHRQQEEQP